MAAIGTEFETRTLRLEIGVVVTSLLKLFVGLISSNESDLKDRNVCQTEIRFAVARRAEKLVQLFVINGGNSSRNGVKGSCKG